MTSKVDLPELTKDEESLLISLHWGCGRTLDLVFLAAVELNLFEIISKAGPDAELSAAEIASHLPTQNEQAAAMLDRVLQLLASYSIVKSSVGFDKDGDGLPTRLYGLTNMSKYLVPGEGAFSMTTTVFFGKDKAMVESWFRLKDAILEGGIPFNKANGTHLFEHIAKDNGLNAKFNEAMLAKTTHSMKEILETYKGFEDLEEVMDVGGGIGTTLHILVSKYPWIHGINYDLPHVIRSAPIYPGVEHVEGDMFQSLPKAKVILIKNILHDWTDEHCLKILKNCWDALPDSGKVIIIEMILPESPEANLSSRLGFTSDLCMLVLTPGGKERTQKEFETLGKRAGFTSSKLKSICDTNLGVLELYKE